MGWRRAHLLLMRGVLVPLAQVFITWLRDSTSAPDVLKSAAHAMKHSVQRQASTDCKLPPPRAPNTSQMGQGSALALTSWRGVPPLDHR